MDGMWDMIFAVSSGMRGRVPRYHIFGYTLVVIYKKNTFAFYLGQHWSPVASQQLSIL